MPRRSLTDLQRLKIFEATRGRCHICELPIMVGQKWDVEHVIPLAIGGEDGGDNLKPAHRSCHAVKSKRDAGIKAKTDRLRAKHIGARKPSRFPKPPPGSRFDWKLGRRVFDKGA